MKSIYPVSPTTVPVDLSKPKKSYQQRAILAMAGLSLFVTLYFALTAWFIWTAYRLFTTPNVGARGIFIAVLASFLAVFMVKPLLRVKHSHQTSDLEIYPQDQPQLFEFIYRLADEAKAPRPHKVFLSPRVNAAVFYDVSILNLFFTSKKNLEIGLALVNVLSLGEFKAVLAHEFGHFAQRSMAVGRWVYIAQQIASHIITERDALDKFLRVLSRLDVRIAWIGWILSLIVWSIRSLLETVFQWLILAQRALSREMEFQADLVAVSLTGSDALVHALHKIGAADDAWDRSLSFASSEMRQGRLVGDLFSIQTRMIAKMRTILNDSQYGQVPPLPSDRPEHHRVFEAALAEPPRMWSTHPSNVDREDNAKRTYIANEIDVRSAWDLFVQPTETRKQMTAQLISSASPDNKAKIVPLEDSVKQFEVQYGRLYFNCDYRGNYLGRSIVRHAATAEELYDLGNGDRDLDLHLDSLYPESLTDDLEQLKILENERVSLIALQERRVQAPGGIIKHRGKPITRLDLPTTIATLEEELAAVRQRIVAHDCLCRTTHHYLAAKTGNGWSEYLTGLVKILHYTDHTEADLVDIQGYLGNVVRVITADRNVSRRELKRLLVAADGVYQVLADVYKQSSQVQLDSNLKQFFSDREWSEVLGKFDLVSPCQQNISEWMQVIDNWINVTVYTLSALRMETLEQLLHSEKTIADAYRQGKSLPQAPAPSLIPSTYSVLLPGKERKRQTRLGWWDRFQTADGIVAQILRLLVAGAIIVSVPWAVATLGN